MPTARDRSRHTGERGQVLPIFALVVGLIVLFSSLLIDGSLAFQTFHRDLDTIAYHAARAGADAVAQPCTRSPGANCALSGAAPGQAKPGRRSARTGSGITLIVNSATVVGDTITVHLRTC